MLWRALFFGLILLSVRCQAQEELAGESDGVAAAGDLTEAPATTAPAEGVPTVTVDDTMTAAPENAPVNTDGASAVADSAAAAAAAPTTDSETPAVVVAAGDASNTPAPSDASNTPAPSDGSNAPAPSDTSIAPADGSAGSAPSDGSTGEVEALSKTFLPNPNTSFTGEGLGVPTATVNSSAITSGSGPSGSGLDDAAAAVSSDVAGTTNGPATNGTATNAVGTAVLPELGSKPLKTDLRNPEAPEYNGPVYVPPPNSTPAPVTVAPERKEGGFWWLWGLLIAGMVLLLFILIGMFYACCCMKSKGSADVEARHPAAVPTISVSKPTTISPLVKSEKYPDSAVTTSTYTYRETKQTASHAGNFPSTPNNSFAVIAPGVNRVDGSNGEPTSLENRNFRGPHPTPPGSDFKYITPKHIDPSLTAPPPVYHPRTVDPNRISSRDVVTASRVNNAVLTVASNAPPKGRPDSGEGNSLERDTGRPVLRGASTLERASSPRPFGSHRTTLLITPAVNRDPNDPSPPGPELTYSDYFGMLRNEPSDFAQYSPDGGRAPPVHRYPEQENVESQV